MIAAVELSETYRGRPAVTGIDLTVLPGEAYGFLGPNGAGKIASPPIRFASGDGGGFLAHRADQAPR